MRKLGHETEARRLAQVDADGRVEALEAEIAGLRKGAEDDAMKICEQRAELQRLHIELGAVQAERVGSAIDWAHRDLVAYWSGPGKENPPEGAERLSALDDSDSS